ncbi:NAD(P)/FAD-dependent oxidoreductase [Acinetobacter sp. C32I]|uniref:flavin-containing monooxygenase n=1 Tax=Acinetobacter sp. C32I TaxID=2950074 RepID=UPI0020368280|nr:NAD(P)/FAD-dependent oxidoreductase [Acinetobacter sp. C32I]USA52272.1 NAD(P)/FAD-dependent oxidoreductase [Acinetobacter sp. C32I]
MIIEVASGTSNIFLDAVVVGAGFSGLYMLLKLREAGFKVKAFEKGDGVGGVWYWNRYPGAKCDTESFSYNYTFSEALFQEWSWSSRYPAQPEILAYLNYVADKFDLKKDIQFNQTISSAHFNELNQRWDITTQDGQQFSAKYFISGVGCLSASNMPEIQGQHLFQGQAYHTGHWPHAKVDFKGKRVGVIGTGSSGVQSIPEIAKEAEHLVVFQRTPQYVAPANNRPYSDQERQQIKNSFQALKTQMHQTMFGMPQDPPNKSAMEDSDEHRLQVFENAWDKGGFYLATSYNDLLTNEQSNAAIAAFFRDKIADSIEDDETAKQLQPQYYYGTKRPILGTQFYETFNQPHVKLVNIKENPIVAVDAHGLQTIEEYFELDILVYATGYDGMTGPLFKMDIRGVDGISLQDKWENGAATRTYLGLTTAGFPNFFMITGPESPSVLSNMPLCIEQHVEWIIDCLNYMQNCGYDQIEASVAAEEQWSTRCQEIAEYTLFTKAESWYTGANITGKPRRFLIYLPGIGPYRQLCNEIAADQYRGFQFKQKNSNSVVRSA